MNPESSPSAAGGGSALEIEVAAGLVFRGGKLLIAQRPAGSHLEGLWEFPGGKRERSESFEECLARELREELGIEVGIGRLFASLTHAYPGKTVHLRFYVCRLERHEPRPLGCPDFRWITAAELGRFEFPAADAQVIARLAVDAELWR